MADRWRPRIPRCASHSYYWEAPPLLPSSFPIDERRALDAALVAQPARTRRLQSFLVIWNVQLVAPLLALFAMRIAMQAHNVDLKSYLALLVGEN